MRVNEKLQALTAELDKFDRESVKSDKHTFGLLRSIDTQIRVLSRKHGEKDAIDSEAMTKALDIGPALEDKTAKRLVRLRGSLKALISVRQQIERPERLSKKRR